MALANSRLRFQNTQFHWQRFRGQLSYTTELNSGPVPTTGNPAGDALRMCSL